MKLGSNLKKLRKEKGVNQIEVATLLGVKQNTYSQYESGTRQLDIESLVKLSMYYDVTLDTIVGNKQQEANVHLLVEELVDALVTNIYEEIGRDSKTSLEIRSYALEIVKEYLTRRLLDDR